MSGRFFTVIGLLWILLYFRLPVFAVNYLQNADFESNSLSSWSSSGGGATATISSELVRSGNFAIQIKHDTTSSYGYQQIIGNIEGGMFYEVKGYGATHDSNTGSYFLRVAWYESSDGSGSQLASPNDTSGSSDTSGEWIYFSEVVQSPQNAKSVKVRLVLTSKTSKVLAMAYFDDIVFQESVAPTSTPTNTPTVTHTPVPTHTPTLIHTPTKTPTQKPTTKPTNTTTQKPTITEKTLVNATLSGISKKNDNVLGASDFVGSSDSGVIPNKKKLFQPYIISLLFVSAGSAMLAISLIVKKMMK